MNEQPCIEYRIKDSQIFRHRVDAAFPVSHEGACAQILRNMVGCKWQGLNLLDVMKEARDYLHAEAYEYHHSTGTQEHVFRFHLRKTDEQ